MTNIDPVEAARLYDAGRAIYENLVPSKFITGQLRTWEDLSINGVIALARLAHVAVRTYQESSGEPPDDPRFQPDNWELP